MEKKAYKLTPAVKDIVWGGRRLIDLGKSTEADRIAESWELSFTKGGEATVSGIPLTVFFPRESWGKACEGFPEFPVLTKFIDARDKLSVQVHPSDEYALANEGQYGKTEMWYVVSADEGAGLYMGTVRELGEDEFRAAIADGTVEELLNFRPVRAGDVFFIPAGTIHAIGAGVLIYEIQQNSTLTYRLYDYMRPDASGKLRPLHVEQAMKVAHLSPYATYERDPERPRVIGECEYFRTSNYKLNFTSMSLFADERSFIAVTSVGGSGTLNGEKFNTADTFFIPAGAGEVNITADGELDLIVVDMPE